MAPRRGLDTVESDGGRHRPASTKVRAADSVLNHSAKAIEIEDIEVRLQGEPILVPPDKQSDCDSCDGTEHHGMR